MTFHDTRSHGEWQPRDHQRHMPNLVSLLGGGRPSLVMPTPLAVIAESRVGRRRCKYTPCAAQVFVLDHILWSVQHTGDDDNHAARLIPTCTSMLQLPTSATAIAGPAA